MAPTQGQQGDADRPRSEFGLRRSGSYHYAGGSHAPGRPQRVRRRLTDVWAWNFDAEFDELLASVARARLKVPHKCPVVLALDTEFPGFLREAPPSAPRAECYSALRENVDRLQPIQVGLAVANAEGAVINAWSFNLWFDLAVEPHTEESIRFLSEAGVDFSRLATEGIDAAALAWRLHTSGLLGCHGSSPRWVTFSGWYDWGYVLKLLIGQPMPPKADGFHALLEGFCPRREELRDWLPHGSLGSLAHLHGVERLGRAHTAGSDALMTLELFLQVMPRGDHTVAGMPLAAPLAAAKTPLLPQQRLLPPSAASLGSGGAPVVVACRLPSGAAEQEHGAGAAAVSGGTDSVREGRQSPGGAHGAEGRADHDEETEFSCGGGARVGAAAVAVVLWVALAPLGWTAVALDRAADLVVVCDPPVVVSTLCVLMWLTSNALGSLAVSRKYFLPPSFHGSCKSPPG